MEVFVNKADAKPAFDVMTLMNIPDKKRVKGEVGIEIEVEGNKFPKPDGYAGTHHPVKLPGATGWSYVHDGSLRGDDNAEYLLTAPVSFADVPKKVDGLFSLLDKYGSVIKDSNRTSVHVHLNVQGFHLNRLTAFMGLYFCFEEILTEWCGDHRVGNLFCLRAKDAPAIVSRAKAFIQSDGKERISDNLHYSGLNIHALSKHGSIEVRTLRGVTDPTTIVEWVSILQRLYEVSETYEDPRSAVEGFSGVGALEFFYQILGDRAPIIRRDVDWTDEQIRDSMYEGIRFAQDLCYCRDWGDYKKLILKPDPFKRSVKSVARSIESIGLSNPFLSPTQPQPMPPPATPQSFFTNELPDDFFEDEF